VSRDQDELLRQEKNKIKPVRPEASARDRRTGRHLVRDWETNLSPGGEQAKSSLKTEVRSKLETLESRNRSWPVAVKNETTDAADSGKHEVLMRKENEEN
jgi:hypothetical protein